MSEREGVVERDTVNGWQDGRVTRFELDEEGFDAAMMAVQAGQAIVLPTDTVYGIGADPFNADAVQALLDAKHRGQDMPPPVLIAERSMMRALTGSVPAGAKELAARFWPGPLTIILAEQQAVDLHLGETAGTVAIRVPDHDATRELLRRTGPLAVSSANLSGQPSATNVEEAEAQLGDSVAVYLDGGPTPGLTPSTIVDFASNEDGVVLRLGALSLEELQEVVPSITTFEAPEPPAVEGVAVEEDSPIEADATPEEENPAAEGWDEPRAEDSGHESIEKADTPRDA